MNPSMPRPTIGAEVEVAAAAPLLDSTDTVAGKVNRLQDSRQGDTSDEVAEGVQPVSKDGLGESSDAVVECARPPQKYGLGVDVDDDDLAEWLH